MTRPSQRPRPRQVEPLAPPPGSFDRVLGRARQRRHRQLTACAGVVGVFLAGIGGGLAMGDRVGQVQANLVQLVDRSDPGPGDPAASTAVTARAAAPAAGKAAKNRSAASRAPKTAAPPVMTPPAVAPPALTTAVLAAPTAHGRVVDAAGDAVAGMYVYTDTTPGPGFAPSEVAADVTDARGRYDVACTSGPLLLTSWPLNTPVGDTADGSAAATEVRRPGCVTPDSPRRTVRTTVATGSTVTGVVRTDASCADAEFTLRLRLRGEKAAVVVLSGLQDGDTYRVSGLSDGTHVLGIDGVRTAVAVSTTPLERDVTFTCPAGPEPSETPSPTPTPSPEPSPSGSGSPTASPTASPGPSGSGSPTGPTSSGSPTASPTPAASPTP